MLRMARNIIYPLTYLNRISVWNLNQIPNNELIPSQNWFDGLTLHYVHFVVSRASPLSICSSHVHSPKVLPGLYWLDANIALESLESLESGKEKKISYYSIIFFNFSYSTQHIYECQQEQQFYSYTQKVKLNNVKECKQ